MLKGVQSHFRFFTQLSSSNCFHDLLGKARNEVRRKFTGNGEKQTCTLITAQLSPSNLVTKTQFP